MSREHLSEIELMELVEGDPGEGEEASSRAHVAACRECAESLAGLEHGRAALRAAPMLELPEPRFRELLDALPAQEREPSGRRSALARPRRWLVVLAPAAAVVVAVVLAVSLNEPGGDQEAAAPAPTVAEEAQEFQAEVAQDSAAPGEADGGGAASAEPAPPAEPPAEAATPPAPAAEAPSISAATTEEIAARQAIRSVAGTPEEVAERLRGRELNARVVERTVQVEGADPEAVSEALEDLPDGDVAVIVVPAS
jgi:hypothetical protein